MKLKEWYEKNGNKWEGLKLRRKEWANDGWWKPFYKDKYDLVYGIGQNMDSHSYRHDDKDDWEEYKPKPEMKTYYRPKQAYHKKDDCYANDSYFPWYGSKEICSEKWPNYSIDEWEESQFPARGGD